MTSAEIGVCIRFSERRSAVTTTVSMLLLLDVAFERGLRLRVNCAATNKRQDGRRQA